MDSKNDKISSEKRTGVLNEHSFIEDEVKFCSRNLVVFMGKLMSHKQIFLNICLCDIFFSGLIRGKFSV